MIDISQRDDPALLGTLRMPAVGEQMYLLGSEHVVLLKQSTRVLLEPFWFGGGELIDVIGIGAPLQIGAPTFRLGSEMASPLTLTVEPAAIAAANVVVQPTRSGSSVGEVVIVNVREGKPHVKARVEYNGSLLESRLVGNVLYVASYIYKPATESLPAVSGTELASIDLADPEQPMKRGTVFLPGRANAVMATDRFFFVASSEGAGGTAVDIVDVSAADGTMAARGRAKVNGHIADKFKMHLEGDVLTVIAEGWQAQPVTPDRPWTWNTPVTRLATFSLSDPSEPQELGKLDIAPGETLRATRFDDGRVYIVTFVQIDPLWVVDLRKPENPKVLGHVEAPGFSTYIEPLGDRLVTIGLVNWRPAVSLFDVSDDAAPRLLTQVILGDGWASSEAVWDEKAFNVIPEENLILLPVSDYSGVGEAGRVQLLDLLPNKIVRRGVITRGFHPRRSEVLGSRIMSISPTRLVVVNAADRDRPMVTADLEIAWRADRVFAVGDHVLQLGHGSWGGSGPGPTVTVSPSTDLEESLAVVDLPNRPVVGATVGNNVLYILQAPTHRPIYGAQESGAAGEAAHSLLLTAVNLASLPQVTKSGSLEIPTTAQRWYSEAHPLWPDANTLLWSVQGVSQSYVRLVWNDPPPYTYKKRVPAAPGHDAQFVYVDEVHDAPGSWWQQWVAATSRWLFAIDVSSKTPKLASALHIGKGEPWDVAEPVAAENTVYISHKHLGALRKEHVPWGDGRLRDPKAFLSDVHPLANRHFLQIVDYSNVNAPVVHEHQPNLPGRLVHVDDEGQLFFTIGQDYALPSGAPIGTSSALHVSSLAGASAHLLDRIPLSSPSQPVEFRDRTAFVLKPEPAFKWTNDLIDGPHDGPVAIRLWYPGRPVPNEDKSLLARWSVTPEGKFQLLSSMTLEHETSLRLFGGLAVAQGGREVRLIDAVDPTAMAELGVYEFEGWVWPNLEFADGDEERGFFVPLGEFGAEAVALPAP